MVIHPQARTTLIIRQKIKKWKNRIQKDLAKYYNVTPQTIRKWQKREDLEDRSRPRWLQTKLNEAQEQVVVELCQHQH